LIAVIAGVVLYTAYSELYKFIFNFGTLRASWDALGSCSTLSCILEHLGACLEISEIAIICLGIALLMLLPRERRSYIRLLLTLGLPTYGQFSLSDNWPFASVCLCIAAQSLFGWMYPSPEHAGRVFLCLFSMCLMLVRIHLGGNTSEQSPPDAGGQAKEEA